MSATIFVALIALVLVAIYLWGADDEDDGDYWDAG